MRRGAKNSFAALSIVIMTAIVFMACGGTATVVGGGSTTTPSATTTIATTSTSVPPTAVPTCAALLPGAGAATGGPSFGDLPFPANSVSTPLAVHSSGTGSYTISLFNACSSGTTAADVKAFYANQLVGQGWATDPTLPFDGSFQEPCGDPYCWIKGAYLSTRLIGLEAVTDKGNNVVTYTWRVFVPPPAGTCKASDFPTTTNGSVGAAEFQSPPLTYYYAFAPGLGQYPYVVCSAGDPTSIITFLKKSIPAAGIWKITGSTATTISIEKPTTPASGFCSTAQITAGSQAGYPGEWGYTAHPPASPCV